MRRKNGCGRNGGGCPPAGRNGSGDPATILEEYLRYDRPRAEEDRHFMRSQASLETAIRIAALARSSRDKRQSHQCRIPGAALTEAERLLQRQAGSISRIQSFDELLGLVERTIRPVRGIGALAVYDVAARLGEYLGLVPRLVYLHAGAAAGARALGFRGSTLDPRDLPEPLCQLGANDLEDLLCIYKDRLAGFSGWQRPRCRER